MLNEITCEKLKAAVRVAAVILAIYLCFFLVIQPRLIRHDEVLTIINSRIGEIDINHMPGHKTTIWYQDRGINVRLLVWPW